MLKLMMKVFLMIAMVVIINAPETTLAATDQGTTSTQQANAPNGVDKETIKNSLDPENLSEYSRKIYAVLFGDAGGMLGEADPSVFGFVVGQFNIIALIMGCLVAAYSLIGGAINTAASGEMLGRSWSSAWMPIRTVMAFGLIIPLPATAPYSPAQMAVIYAVIVGDNMATAVTKEATKRVASNQLKVAGGVTPPPASISVDIAGSAFCAANEWNIRTMNGANAKNHVYAIAEYAEGPLTKSIKLTANTMPAPYDMPIENISSLKFGSTGQCGSIYFATQDRINQTLGKEMTSAESSYASFNKVIADDLRFYAEIENALRGEQLDSMAFEAEMAAFEPLSESHSALIDRYASVVADRVNSLPNRLKEALHQGFGKIDPSEFTNRAVTHYTEINSLLHKMAQYSAAENGAMINALQGIANIRWDVCFANTDECKNTYNSELLAELNKGIKIQSTMAGVSLISRGLSSGVKSGSGDSVKEATMPESVEVEHFMAQFSKYIKTNVLTAIGVGGGWVAGSNQQGIPEDTSSMDFQLNPMIYLHNIGHALIAAATAITAALITTGALATAASQSVAGLVGAGVVEGGFNVVMAFAVPATWGLIGAGQSMSMISMVPIVIGAWGFISIICMAIQGVAAAPFAVVLLSTPGGEGATNQTFQRFLLHLTHLLLAPMIFVLGAFASVILIVIGGNIAAYVFVNNSGFFGSESWIVSIGTIFFYVVFMLYVVIKCSMFQLSMQNDLMEIIGGGFHKPMGGDVSGQVMSTSNGVNSAVNGTVKAAKGATNIIRQKRGLAPIP